MQVESSTNHDSGEADQFLDDVRDTNVNKSKHGSKRRPESVREHASNYRASVGYINKMKYGEGPRDDTDESDDEGSNKKSVRESHYNRKSNKE